MEENTVNSGILQLAVLKKLVVLKGLMFNIFLKLVYRVQECIRYDGVFKTCNCRRHFPKWQYRIFEMTSKLGRTAAPPVLDPLYLN